MIQPTVVHVTSYYEIWKFRDQYFRARIYFDGVVQLYRSDEYGRAFTAFPVNSHNMHDRDGAVKWLNENVE